MRMVKNQRQSQSQVTNRSEELRKRRAESSQKRAATAGSRASHPVNVRPVIVRGNSFGTPIHRKSAPRPRRAFYLTMDQSTGSELRLPTIPLVNPGWRLLSAAIVAMALLGIFSIWNSPYFLVNGITVQGLQRLSAEELTDELNLNNLSIVEIDPNSIQETLAKDYPELAEVNVTVELPNLVTVSAIERQPVMAWQKGDQVTWVDSEGVLFPVRGEAGPLVTIHSDDDIPLAPVTAKDVADGALGAVEDDEDTTGPTEVKKEVETTRNVDPALITAAQALSQKLPPETALVYDRQNGFGWMAPEGWQVYIGASLSDFEAKFNMYQQLAAHLASQGIQPRLVSVAQINAPFYRLEQ